MICACASVGSAFGRLFLPVRRLVAMPAQSIAVGTVHNNVYIWRLWCQLRISLLDCKTAPWPFGGGRRTRTVKLARFRIKNYRSFLDEQEITFANANTLIGPNSAGKSSLLRAIQLFFLAFPHDQTLQAYEHDRDLTFQPYEPNRDCPRGLVSGRTSLTAEFQFDDADTDDEILKEYESLRRNMNLPAVKTRQAQINLQFSEKSEPRYWLFPERSIRHVRDVSGDFRERQLNLVGKILRRFDVIYVPAEKELKDRHTKTILDIVRKEICDQVKEFIDDVGYQPAFLSQELNRMLSVVGISGVHMFFDPPRSCAEPATGFATAIVDRSLEKLFENNAGVHWLIIARLISWVSLSVRRRAGLRCLWLIEEPESYLHPESFSEQTAAFDQIGDNATIVYTTNPLGFVPADVSHVHGVFFKDKHSTITGFNTYADLCLQIEGPQPKDAVDLSIA